MKICIVSDSHDRADALEQAVREAKARGAEAVIHCGDLIGAQTVKPALAHGLPVHLVHGNNIGDVQALHFQMPKAADCCATTARMHASNSAVAASSRSTILLFGRRQRMGWPTTRSTAQVTIILPTASPSPWADCAYSR